ncbi:glycosyltransferase family A protein [Flavobacterium collinsii]|mgnify:CR=1 FL=1|uniref:glycosyltransferase family A protein n=1 Tax=Flavobacterium collinsii TaxID=1114861 RepID=UPI003757BC6E
MLAIVIPYYKLIFFKETLKSLSDQTDKRFKVYIGNDASPEDPSLLLEQYRNKIDLVYHLFDNNLGGASLIQHWERCIRLVADEEWVMILGDDDVLEPNFVEEFYSNLEEVSTCQSNVIRYATKLIDGEDKILSQVYKHPKHEKATDFFCRKFSGKTRSSLSEYIFKKEVYVTYRFTYYPLAWHSDDMAVLEFSENKIIFTINESSVKIRVSEESLSGSTFNIAEKRLAASFFYMDLVRKKLSLFNKKERLFLLYQLEDSIKKSRKLDFKEWSLLSKCYIENFSPIPVLKFTRRFIISFTQ